ncbi:MAG: hypothetical protein WCF20_00670 [Methylovirgula sp.]
MAIMVALVVFPDLVQTVAGRGCLLLPARRPSRSSPPQPEKHATEKGMTETRPARSANGEPLRCKTPLLQRRSNERTLPHPRFFSKARTERGVQVSLGPELERYGKTNINRQGC